MQYRTTSGHHVKKVGFATLHIDGGCRPTNPGPAGMAAVVNFPAYGLHYELARPLGIKTNNQAEYIALIVGVKYAHTLGANGLDIFTDSKLVLNQMKDLWYIRERRLYDLRHEARGWLDAMFEKNWELTWIPREQNTEADALCTEAILCNNPWIPNFKDPFRPPHKRWFPHNRSVMIEVCLPHAR